jgi:hypothetical protein
MNKIILEFDYMPKNCRQCTLSIKKEKWVCGAFDMMMEVDFNNLEERAIFCPLKEIKLDKYSVI